MLRMKHLKRMTRLSLLLVSLFLSPALADFLIDSKGIARVDNCEVAYLSLLDENSSVIAISIDPKRLPPLLSEEDLVRYLFRYHERLLTLGPPSHPVHAQSVAGALIGPPNGRPSYVEIGDSNYRSIQTTIDEYMKAGLPIEGVTFWGGAKQYGIGDNLGIDAADLLAILRYQAMDRAVRNAGYQPGVRVQLVFEDLGRRFMGNNTPEMKKRVEHYQEEMARLVRITSTVVRFTPESEIIARNEVPPRVREILDLPKDVPMKGSEELFFRLAAKSEDIMYSYLRTTEEAATKAPADANDTQGFARVRSLPEYQELEKLGFKGGIPMDQRDSVRSRTRLRLGNADLPPAELDRHVAKYFAQGFARAMFNLRVGTSVPEGQSQPLPTLSYSFLPYPPGTPDSLIQRRVELAAVSDTGGDRVVPCWGGCAVLEPNGNIRFSSKVRRPDTQIPIRLESVDGTSITIPIHYEATSTPSPVLQRVP